MKPTHQIAKQLRDVHHGGNWSASNLQDQLAEVTWKQASETVAGLHSIAELVFHMNYYVSSTLDVMRGSELNAQDEFSFDSPAIESLDDWNQLLAKTWADTESLAALIDRMPEEQLSEAFVEDRLGNHDRWLHGLIEHCHYHLGQIAVLKKILTDHQPNE